MEDVYNQIDDLAATTSNAEIARLTGLHEATVSRYLRALTRYPGRPGRPRGNPLAFERGRKLWAGGLSIAKLHRKLPVSLRTIYRWVERWERDAL